MSKSSRDNSHARTHVPPSGVSDTRTMILGGLVLLSTFTTILPAFAEGALDRTRAAAVLVVAAAWLITWAAGLVRYTRQQAWWLAGMGALCISVGLSAVMARFPVSALLGGLGTGMGFAQWVALAVVALGASSVPIGRVTRRWIAATYLWVVPVAVVGLMQATQGRPVTAGLLNDSLFGLVLVIWFAPALGLALTSRAPAERWAWVAVAALLGVSVAASQARAASAGIVLELGLALAFIAPALVPTRGTALRAVGFVVAGVSALAVAVVAIAGAFGVSSPFAGLGTTFLTRAYLYRTALESFAQAPLLGAGPDGFQLAAQRFVEPTLMALEHGSLLVNATSADPHSSALRILVEAGVVGAAALGFAIVGWAVAVRRTQAPSSQADGLRRSFAIGAAGFALTSLVSPWPVTIGATPVVVVGLAAASFGTGEPLRDLPRAGRIVAAAVLSAGLLFVAWSGVSHYSAFLTAVASQTPVQKQVALEEAKRAMPWSQEARFQALWAQGIALESGVGDRGEFQRAVDADPLASAYAPLLAEFARQSLVSAQREGAQDLSWEREAVSQAQQAGPGIPEVAAERLHLALVSGDPGQIAEALAAAQGVAEPAEQYAAYAAQAQAALAR